MSRQRARICVSTVRNDYTSTGLNTVAWTQLVASLGSDVNEIEIFDSSGSVIEFGVGASGTESRQFFVMPGGSGRFSCLLNKGMRLSLRAVDTNANTGQVCINLWQ